MLNDWRDKMFICELCGNTVAHVNHADVCKSCASMTFTAVKQEVKKAVEDKNNQEFMLAYFNISLAQFEAVTHENLTDIIDSEFAGFYKNDAKRVLWHEYRENAFTKKGDLRKAVEKKILATITAQEVEEVVIEEVPVIEVAQEIKATKSAPKKSISERDQYALDKAAEHRATAKLLGAQALTGSPKQKAWAEQIRKEFIKKIDNETVLSAMILHDEAQKASFWIDLRDCDYLDIVKALAGELVVEKLVVQEKLIKSTKKAIEDYGRENNAVVFRLQMLKNEYGVEL